MKDLSKLEVFSYGQIAATIQILNIMEKYGLNKEDLLSLKKYNEDQRKEINKKPVITEKLVSNSPSNLNKRMEKPCCGEGKIDAAVKVFREKQRLKSRTKTVKVQRGGKRRR